MCLKTIGLIAICLTLGLTHIAKAETTTTEKAQVIQILDQQEKNDPLSGRATTIQKLKVEILDKSESHKQVEVDNDYQPFAVGDKLYVNHVVYEGVSERYDIADSYRLGSLYLFLGLFLAVVIIFGGWQGIRGLLSLFGSLFLIIYLLLPQLFHGTSPIIVSLGVSSLIIVLGSYITHGFNKTTTAAVIGMLITIALIGTLAHYAVVGTKLTGFNTEETLYLNMDTSGKINMQGLLLGSIMIGLLGVLYDIAIGQAIAVEELYALGGHLGKKLIYQRGLRIGREHIGALVNTLAIAYVGTSLPLLLLLFYDYKQPHHLVLNSEIFATEIIRILIGGIGIVLAVPITTLLAVSILSRTKAGQSVHSHK